MHRIIAVFAFMVATMWLVIAIAELAELVGDGGMAVVVTSLALAAAFDFAGYRLWRHPPEITMTRRSAG